MRSLHFHLPFGMDHRACAPPIRFRLLPTLWTGDLLVPPISMLQQQLPQHLSHQLPPQHRQLACYLIKVRLPMLFPPLPHLLKHLLCASHKFRLRLFSFHFAPPFALLSSYSKSNSFQPSKKSGMHPPEGVHPILLSLCELPFKPKRKGSAEQESIGRLQS